MNKRPHICKQERIATGDWLELDNIFYEDRFGVQRTWEAARRVNDAGAVGVLATMKPSGNLLFIRQYRAPLDSFVIECPAGLVDAGESVETTALRELHEETGYTGKIVRILPPVCSSPGLTDECISLVIMDIDENDPVNHDVTPELEGGEDIETIIVPAQELGTFVSDAIERGDQVDAKIISWIVGKLGW